MHSATVSAPLAPPAPPARAFDWNALIRPEHVHGSLYTDEDIFRLELEKIWYRSWVYVGHASEIPNANDFVLKTIGLEEVVMTRDKDGAVHLLHNRCPHRGNRVVAHDGQGATRVPSPATYHGWNIRQRRHAEAAIPFPRAIEGVDRKDLGLGQVSPASAVYKRLRLRLASAAEGESRWKSFLGAAAGDAIDNAVPAIRRKARSRSPPAS